jgi:hypothetical protein
MEPIPPIALVDARPPGGPTASLQPALPPPSQQPLDLQDAMAPTGQSSEFASLRQTMGRVASPLAEGWRSPEQMRSDLLSSIDMSDPVKTMVALADHSIEAQGMFAKLHISTSLASAATSLFGSLLRNQQQ